MFPDHSFTVGIEGESVEKLYLVSYANQLDLVSVLVPPVPVCS